MRLYIINYQWFVQSILILRKTLKTTNCDNQPLYQVLKISSI